MCTVTRRNAFTPILTWLNESSQQQEPRFLDLCPEYIPPLKGPRLFGEHDLFLILGRKKKKEEESTRYLDHFSVARKKG